jgi:Zn-finger nucleic acid-binding protein
MERDGHIGFCCSECSGVLLTQRYVSTINFKPESSSEKFYAGLTAGLTEKTNCVCPSCNSNMYVAVHKNVELDFCTHCKSVWFDFNELGETITDFKSGKVGSPTYTKADLASYVSEFLMRLF